MGFAPSAYRLFTEHLSHNPKDPAWPARDRFVLSAGHGSALLYALLHLCGYNLSIDELKRFRQMGSQTPGHPEFGHTPGVEITTGPLGQGIATAVGMAIAQKYLAARFNRPGFNVMDYKIKVVVGDGCLQEGVAAEAASLAGHLGLDNLVVLYDDNKITIDGRTSLSFTEKVTDRFLAYGWSCQSIGGDGHDLDSLDLALQSAHQKKGTPHLIKISSIIGYGSPKYADNSGAHGSPLGKDERQSTAENLGWGHGPFEVPASVKAHFDKAMAKGAAAQAQWEELMKAYRKAHPELAKELDDLLAHKLPELQFPEFAAGTSIATRAASGKVLNAIMPKLPGFMGGSADLSPSNNTRFEGAQDFQPSSFEGRYIRFGVREHAMGAIVNGIGLNGMTRAYGATFLSFCDYMLPALRVAAISQYPSVFVFTHDSIGVGEDGPTHQPVEQVAYLRHLPGLTSFRPADATETVEVWRWVVNHKVPVAMSLTRQNLPVLDRSKLAPASGVAKGGYVLIKGEHPKVLLIATGSEVSLALLAYEELAQVGISAQLVSLPSAELFDQQDSSYKAQVMPAGLPRVGVEAGIASGLAQYLGPNDRFIGMQGFGASAPADELYRHFGITKEAIIEAARGLVG